MKIFDRLFSRSSKSETPDNSRLLKLLDIYWKTDGKGNTYENVVSELMNGNSFLMLPGLNEGSKDSAGWTTTNEDRKIGLSSVYTRDGIKVLAAFTDENALFEWAKQPCQYTSLRSQDVLNLCDANDIARIVINNNSPNFFMLERNRSDTTE